MLFSPTDCARARESVSAQLDGELPELELDRLETHLLVCPACTAWANEVRDVTRRLREAGLEQPAERFVLPRRRRSWRVSSAVAVASAAAVVATMFVAPGRHTAVRSRHSGLTVSRFAEPAGQHFVVSRVLRLADGMFPGISAANTWHVSFRHV